MVDAAANAVNVRQRLLIVEGSDFLPQMQKPIALDEERVERGLFLRRVIAFAGQHFQIVIGHINFDFAKFSVTRRIRRVIA
jgi:hypothetical protein